MAQTDIIGLAQEMLDAQFAHDDARLGATVSEDFLYEEIGSQRRAQGREEFVDMWREWRRVFPDVKGTIKNSFVSGDQAVTETSWDGTFRGDLSVPGQTIPATGKRMQQYPVAFVYKEADGKLTQMRAYFDMATLLQQIGAAQ